MDFNNRPPAYPRNSINPHSNKFRFWRDMGIPIDRPKQVDFLSSSLKLTRLEDYRDSFARKVDEMSQIHSGIISDEAARRLLEAKAPVQDGSKVNAALVRENSYPDDVYEVELEVSRNPDVDEGLREVLQQGGLVVEASNNSPDPGRYDLIPLNYQAEYSDPSIGKDLNEMR